MSEHDGCADEKVDDDVEDNRACGRQGCDGADGDKTLGKPAYKFSPALRLPFLFNCFSDDCSKLRRFPI